MQRAAATLIAIAKNESFYLTEWIAHHLGIGFDRVIIFNNDSSDETHELLIRISEFEPRLEVIDLPSQPGISPQYSAYNHGLHASATEWLAFLDIDEFLVPWRDQSLGGYLSTIPDEISQIHVNWRGFGSGGRYLMDYDLVAESFTSCSPANWSNNYHYKSLVRRNAAAEIFPHYARLHSGRRCLTDFSDVAADNFGIAEQVVYDGVQINHYQCKTYPEFRRRMNNGNVYVGSDDPAKFLNGGYDRFLELDRNEEQDLRILPFSRRTRSAISVWERLLPARLCSSTLKSRWVRENADHKDSAVSAHCGKGHHLVGHAGLIPCRAQDGPEMTQAAALPDQSENLRITIRLPEPAALPLPCHGLLARPVALPGNIPMAEAEIVQGALPDTVAVRWRGHYLTAHHNGPLTLHAQNCGETECFLPLPADRLHLFDRINSKNWQVRDTGQLVLQNQTRIGANFTLNLSDMPMDLRSLSATEAPDRITLKTPERGPLELIQIDSEYIARACLVTDDDHRGFSQISAMLRQAGFEGFGMDLRDGTASCHRSGGGIIRLATPGPCSPVASQFDRDGIIAAVTQARGNQPGYNHRRFCQSLAGAGCAGYMVSFIAKRVLYVGRNAESLSEQFN